MEITLHEPLLGVATVGVAICQSVESGLPATPKEKDDRSIVTGSPDHPPQAREHKKTKKETASFYPNDESVAKGAFTAKERASRTTARGEGRRRESRRKGEPSSECSRERIDFAQPTRDRRRPTVERPAACKQKEARTVRSDRALSHRRRLQQLQRSRAYTRKTHTVSAEVAYWVPACSSSSMEEATTAILRPRPTPFGQEVRTMRWRLTIKSANKAVA